MVLQRTLRVALVLSACGNPDQVGERTSGLNHVPAVVEPDDAGIRDAQQTTPTLRAEWSELALVEQVPSSLSNPAPLSRWAEAADAAAVLRINSSIVEMDGADPSSIRTRFFATLEQAIKGDAPTSFTLPGGSNGGHTLRNAHVPRVNVGSSYLGFFRQSERHILFVSEVINGTVRVGEDLIPIQT